jgi:DUF971 family protein
MPIPIDPRKKPADVKVHISTGAGLDIIWADGHHSHYDFPYLRDECPCATCNDQRAKQESLTQSAPGLASGAVLPMFKPKAKAQSASPVGAYAIQFHFNDGHNTGIYTYDHLRSICPCPDCAALRTGAGASTSSEL